VLRCIYTWHSFTNITFHIFFNKVDSIPKHSLSNIFIKINIKSFYRSTCWLIILIAIGIHVLMIIFAIIFGLVYHSYFSVIIIVNWLGHLIWFFWIHFPYLQALMLLKLNSWYITKECILTLRTPIVVVILSISINTLLLLVSIS